MNIYKKLETRFARISDIKGAMSVLSWDQAVIMPVGGAAARARQVACLTGLEHELLTGDDVGDWLYEVESRMLNNELFDKWQEANIREMRRLYLHATAVEPALVKERSMAVSECEFIWRKARAESDFKMLLPYLQKVLDLTKEVAEAKGEQLGCSAYDALLDQYDAGNNSADIDRIFGELSGFLPDFTEKALVMQERRGEPIAFAREVSVSEQKKLGLKIMEAMGFDFDGGRLDISTHPFCGGVSEDIRITTRYDEKKPMQSLMGVIHETGHALYEKNLPRHHLGQPVSGYRGMTIHESQSLIMEMQACRGVDFTDYLAKEIEDIWGVSGDCWSAANIYKHNIHIKRDSIRVEADEVTYPSHVILRYKIERALIEGSLDLVDLPDAFNDGMEALLGIRPVDNRRGCLQDIHWPLGDFGYFPCYTLGAIAAAQLFEAALADNMEILDKIAEGDFEPLTAWLRGNVHSRGSLLSTADILKEATGSELNCDAYKSHLERRYIENIGE